ncbi:MAG: hypothetical protein BGN86_12825 [Caulobacterales bacterium 68-7]|nr:MAG: hypothetical protein BGN86_12825 [Caulobacterales bacterium 68-7]
MAFVKERPFHRGLVIAAVAGAFLALTGAFGSGAAPLVARLVYWIGICLLGAVFGGLLAFLIRRRAVLEDRPWMWAAIMTLWLSVPFTVVVFAITVLAFGGDVSLTRLLGFYPSVVLVTAAITGLNFLTYRRAVEPVIVEADAAPPPFLDRLPAKLRGGELWAVEAEDHYLRLHTSKGQDLILMRLSDAVAELKGIEGAQTHRSWWVARAAIVDVKRGDGRATLTLKDGSEVPVSRAYSRTLRAAGWF